MLPAPLVPKVTLPGCAFASAISSFVDFAGEADVHDEDVRADRDHGDRNEILLDVVVHLLQQRIRDDRPEVAEQDRVTVGRLLRRVFHADGARRARLELDQALLSPHVGELLPDDAGHHVRAAAAGIGHDELDGLGGIVLRVRQPGECRCAAAMRASQVLACFMVVSSGNGIEAPQERLAPLAFGCVIVSAERLLQFGAIRAGKSAADRSESAARARSARRARDRA